MKQKVLFIALVLLYSYKCIDYTQLFENYLCSSGKSAFSVNLN